MGAGLGEVIDLGTSLGGLGGGGLSLVSSLVGLVALGIYALLQGDTGNPWARRPRSQSRLSRA
ncbi:MAG: hypothetical protein RLZZ589_1955 [Cyanobacteriota bacterium]